MIILFDHERDLKACQDFYDGLLRLSQGLLMLLERNNYHVAI